MPKFLAWAAWALLSLPLLVGCADTIDDEYAPFQAYLRLQPVTALQPLREALTSPGMFCVVTITPTHYVCTRTNGTWAQLQRMGTDNYNRPKCISGFIVGTPSMPASSGNFEVVVYDLACPNCYRHDYVERSLSVKSDETATCSRCGSMYNLQNGTGQEPGGGGVLYKYRPTYSPAQDLFLVMN